MGNGIKNITSVMPKTSLNANIVAMGYDY